MFNINFNIIMNSMLVSCKQFLFPQMKIYTTHNAVAAEIKLYAVVNKRSSPIMMIITRHAINLSACNICIQMQPHRITVTHLHADYQELNFVKRNLKAPSYYQPNKC